MAVCLIVLTAFWWLPRLLLRSRSESTDLNATQAVEAVPPTDDWWEDRGLEVGLGAFYAICVAKCFEGAAMYFGQHPIVIADPTAAFGTFPIRLTRDHIETLAELLAFTAWTTTNFLANTKLLFANSHPSERPLSFVYVTVTLGLFYFLAGTIGSEHRQQIILIGLILLTDFVFPLRHHLPDRRGRTIFLLRSALASVFAWSTLFLWPESAIESWWLPVVFFVLMMVHLLTMLRSHRRQMRSWVSTSDAHDY